jgi:hypothetical protein
MAVREIAASWHWVCDGCGANTVTPSRARPKYWNDLQILRDAYDYQGCVVADGSVKLTLCLACGVAAATAINEALDGRRAASVDTRPMDEDAPQSAASLASGAVGEAETPKGSGQ